MQSKYKIDLIQTRSVFFVLHCCGYSEYLSHKPVLYLHCRLFQVSLHFGPGNRIESAADTPQKKKNPLEMKQLRLSSRKSSGKKKKFLIVGLHYLFNIDICVNIH